MSARRPYDDQQLELFRARAGDIAARDAQDLMSWPFFSLAKVRRVTPIDFHMGEVSIRVEATAEHGMATIWDADVLIWAASQIVDARDRGLRTSRLMAATPYEILAFVGRSDSGLSYDRLKAALDRLQSTTIVTSIRQPSERRRHRFSWINEWKERLDAAGRPLGIELILPDWFYAGVLDDALILTIDPRLFRSHRRPRTLAVSPRAQAWRPPDARLELRSAASASEVRQPVAAAPFPLRAARHRPAPAAARLPPDAD
jgi:plasmid replication initiation protein